MQFEDLRKLCIAAAMELAGREERPIPPTMLVPGGERTQLLTLAGFPEEDEARHAYLATFAKEQLEANRVPAWGFLAEGEVGDADAIVAVYGARKKHPRITAAPLADDGVGDFVEAEELDPTAMPFLHPLQHVVDALPAEPADRPEGPGPITPDTGLPLFGD
ncbi:hypothetical protein [Salsipaludibacter albus]|uniref:hypothetical protein n=1 Tax=Salsipaludibacter albus TaxID=2849650 RepID=UPI001EE3A3F3|nr:hypothetical protein [Salsipaludibacter albus]MBY5163907.1 hypothetical protein [Salsipaludibacter albus]